VKISRYFILYAVAAVCACCGVPGNAAETIKWAIADRPTSYILEGNDKGKGTVDLLYAILKRNMSEYDHKYINMTFGRVLQTMKSGENICAVGFKDPERSSLAYFSVPAVISLPFSVVYRKGTIERVYGDTDSISIEKLLQNTDLDGGIMQKRSYGEIDPLIKRYEDKRILHTLSPNSDIIQMLYTDRLDYVIEIVSFANYRARQAGKNDGLRSYAIKEYSQPVLVAHVFCTKNEWGKKMIERINQILIRERKTPEYLELMTHWYDERSRKVIRQYYDSQFLK